MQRSTTAPGGPAGTVHDLYGLDGSLLAEADAATGQTLRDYVWLPRDDASPAADNENVEGASPPPLPLALVTGANTTTPQLLMVHADHLGRSIRLTDATRATVWSASYDPFGQPVTMSGTVDQNLRFPGQYFLIENGLSYNWHRLYDPATGRYTQPDPLRFVDGPSVYGYAGQSPLMRVDRSGLSPSPCSVSPGALITCWTFCMIVPSACAPPPGDDSSMCMARPVTCTAKCNVQQIDPKAICPDRVSGGPASDSSQAKACLMAQKQANANVPKGCYKRHCNCTCN